MMISEHDCRHTDCDICNPEYFPTNSEELARLDAIRNNPPPRVEVWPGDELMDCLNYLAYDDNTWLKSVYNHDGDWIGWIE